MRFILFLGIYIGILGFGFLLLGACATFQQHGLKEWKTEAVYGMLATIALGIAILSAKVNDDIASRQSEARKCKCQQCACECCKPGQARAETKEKDNGTTEDSR